MLHKTGLICLNKVKYTSMVFIWHKPRLKSLKAVQTFNMMPNFWIV